jgi:AcrR family transcriptional regulator
MGARQRIRPTRDETRERLFAAAAEVFEKRGVGAASVEQIVAAAGFTRGAFYSNFATKEELLVAMLDEHVRRSIRHNRELLAAYPDAEGFLAALRADEGREDDPLHRSPLLQIELILHVARTPEQRPALAERLRAMRSLIGEIAASALREAGVEREIDAAQAGMLLLAIEDGLRLHRLIDPAATPPDAVLEAFRSLQQLLLGTRRPRSGARPAAARPRAARAKRSAGGARRRR